MGGLYVDTSAIGRVLLGEPDSPLILRCLADYEQHVASRLLRIELRRMAARRGVLSNADELLGGIALLPVDGRVLEAAETVQPANVATLDAIHLVTALRLADAGHVEAIITYDDRLATGASHHGLPVLAPA